VTARVRRLLAVGALALAPLAAVACEGPARRPPEIRLLSDSFVFTISTDPMPPSARERHRWRVVVLDEKTRQPIQSGEGRIFASSHDGLSTWDGFAKGEEVGTYYGYLDFLTSGEWAMAVEFRADSTLPLQRVDWIQEVRPERPIGADSAATGG
jgi:hypothetical protein